VPTTYTHYKFGVQVLERLPEETRALILENPYLFYTGLHGPDILFFYMPWQKNKVSDCGNDLHRWSGKQYFSFAGEQVVKNGMDHKDLAYMYGFLCHYALDRQAHAIVDDEAARVGSTHTEIEAELDRILLVEDGYDPITHVLTDHIHPSMANATVYARFFPGITPKEVFAAQEMSIFFLGLLVGRSRIKRQAMFAALKAAGMYDNYKGLFINYEPNPACAEPVQKLLDLYDKALPEAVQFIADFTDNITGKKDWSSLFSYNFDGQLVD